ncbi:MAG: amino acid adenylation domain-containing protein, partial [Ktedonobacteraceae bacterium]
SYGNSRLTYSELNRKANQLARYLQHLGAGPEVLVGICMERSLEMVVGLLGILKAGSAYVPLDPAYPPQRLAFMFEDAQISILLTQAHLTQPHLEQNIQVLYLDSAWELCGQESGENLPRTTLATNLAYVMYTSGSTGKPKGTMLSHVGLSNYLRWCIQAYQVSDGQGAPVHSSISFDLTITSLFAPLLAGCAVSLFPEKLGLDSFLSTLTGEADFSFVKVTPSHLTLLQQQLLPQHEDLHAKALIIGGENLLGEHIAFLRDTVQPLCIFNEYGPTETVVGACVYQVLPGQHESGSIPIGRPIANTQMYLLDRNLQLLPQGIPGELYIGGDGVARGYFNQPALTAEKFIPHPFSRIPGARLYKTGDLARYLPDGNLVFLGRID